MDSPNVASSNEDVISHIRVPGGRVRATDWETVADLSDDFGDGHIHLTSHGHLQLRGITDHTGVAQRLAEAGLMPSPRHHAIRNVLCSPLATELLKLVDALDAALCASDGVTGLSEQTLFGIDAGDGAIIARAPDFGVLLMDAELEHFQLMLAGQPTGAVVESAHVARTLVAAAEFWHIHGGNSWRLQDNPAVIPMIHNHLVDQGLISGHCAPELPAASDRPAPIGWIDNSATVSLGAGLQSGQLTSQLARFLAAIEADTSITPWKSVVIHGLSEGVADQVVKVLAPMGLIFDEHSPLL